MHARTIEKLREIIRPRSQFLRSGLSERQLARLLQGGTILRLSRGHYAIAEDLKGLTPEGRHLVSIVATAMTRQVENPFASYSAAVLLGLPLYNFRNARPQVLVSHRPSASNTTYVVCRVGKCQESELTYIEGLLCTNLERTVIDIARFDTPERALTCADAAIRLRFPVARGETITPKGEAWKQELLRKLDGMRGARGIRRATDVLRLADGSADSPLESVARLRFDAFGYEVSSQIAVPSPTGGFYYVDLELLGLNILCEIDGKVKYTDAQVRHGMTADEVVYDEKRRSNWIEGKTQKRLLRVGSRELSTPEAFAQWLRDFDVPAPRRSR